MSAGVGYALLSLVCAGVLNVVFGRYSRARQISGAYLVATGIVIIIGQAVVLTVLGDLPTWNVQAALWGILAGGIALLANALLLESLARIQVSLGSTIYRLNTIAFVIFAVILLGESMSLTKLGGIVLGAVAVVILYQRTGHAGNDRILLICLNAKPFAFCSGFKSRHWDRARLRPAGEHAQGHKPPNASHHRRCVPAGAGRN